MADKKTRKVEPMTITLVIEDPTAILKTASVTVKRGSVGVLRRISYSNTEQLAAALKEPLAAVNGEPPPAPAKVGKPSKPEPTAKDIGKAPAPKAKKGNRDRTEEPVATVQSTLF